MTAGPNLSGKVAVVTGAGRGVGRAIAQTLASHGARVVLTARNTDQVRAAERTIRDAGGMALGIPADVSTVSGAEHLKLEVESALGAPVILINSAGVFGPVQLIKDSDSARWVETLTINTIAAYLTTRAFVNGMIAAGWGRIVNVSSAASLHPPSALNSAYSTSKVALNHFTRSLAVELAGTGVTANVIHPGDVKTDMWADIRDQAERLGAGAEGYRNWVKWVEETGGDPPHKAAELVLRLMSEEAATLNGQFLWIADGLQKPIQSWSTSEDTLIWNK